MRSITDMDTVTVRVLIGPVASLEKLCIDKFGYFLYDVRFFITHEPNKLLVGILLFKVGVCNLFYKRLSS